MGILIDQRRMSGPGVRETPEQIRAYWQTHITRMLEHGHSSPFPLAPERMTLADSDHTVKAYVNNGRWVADCPGGPHGDCHGGIAAWPDHDRGACLDCGTVYRISYPAAATIKKAEKILALRHVALRNWHAHEGETVADLTAENHKHGLTG